MFGLLEQIDHLVNYLIVCVLCRNSARFVWKRTPAAVKESSPELVAAWNIVTHMWTHDHAGVYKALKGFEWSELIQPITSAIGGESTNMLVLFIDARTNLIHFIVTSLYQSEVDLSCKYSRFLYMRH